MPNSDLSLSTEDILALRREGGEELQTLRHAKGLSQRELAKLLNLREFSFVSQIETGRRAPPPDKYAVYARALDIEAKDFVSMLMRYYDPITYEILFGPDTAAETGEA